MRMSTCTAREYGYSILKELDDVYDFKNGMAIRATTCTSQESSPQQNTLWLRPSLHSHNRLPGTCSQNKNVFDWGLKIGEALPKSAQDMQALLRRRGKINNIQCERLKEFIENC